MKPLSLAILSAALPVWRADQLAEPAREAAPRATGFASLDAELPGGGWPSAGLTELLLDGPGGGELRLLSPMLCASRAALLWVAPPLLPYGPALAVLGVAPERLVLAQPERAADAAWAAEQALRSGALAAVLWWQCAQPVTSTTLRRLHLAALEGRTPLFAIRPMSVRSQSSPAPLRLMLQMPAPGRLGVDLFKRRGPPLTCPLVLDLPTPVRRRARRAAATIAQDTQRHAVVRPVLERAAA